MSTLGGAPQGQIPLIDVGLLASFTLEAVTPILIGGYDAKTFHEKLGIRETLRPTSIKGVWRWWTRCLLAAAYYNKCHKHLDIKEADSLASRLLGSTERASKYSLHVEEEEKQVNTIPTNKLMNISRISFSHLYDKVLSHESKFKLKIYKTLGATTYNSEDSFALYSLALALIMDGVGKATSRGFGKLKVSIDPRQHSELARHLQEIYSKPPAEGIKGLIAEAVSLGEQLLDMWDIKCNRGSKGELPPMEVALPDEFMVVKEIEPNISLAQFPIGKILECVGKATLKSSYKESPRDTGEKIHTWIFGLPRAQEPPIIPCNNNIDCENKAKIIKEKITSKNISPKNSPQKITSNLEIIKRKLASMVRRVRKRRRNYIAIPTGYYIIKIIKGRIHLEKLRRRSPVRFTIVPRETPDHRTISIVGFAFLTSDWARIEREGALIHVGAIYRRKNKEVENVDSFKLTYIKLSSTKKELLELLKKFFDEGIGPKNATVKDVIDECLFPTSDEKEELEKNAYKTQA